MAVVRITEIPKFTSIECQTSRKRKSVIGFSHQAGLTEFQPPIWHGNCNTAIEPGYLG